MNPLAVEIWLSMLGAYVMVSLTIWVVARFSPYEWRPPRSCWLGYSNESEGGLLVVENDFTLANSFWFTIGTLMQQGSDLNPKVKQKKKKNV
jgi:ionotropic kainate glutamate receptor 2